jgi:hypothetical protein
VLWECHQLPQRTLHSLCLSLDRCDVGGAHAQAGNEAAAYTFAAKVWALCLLVQAAFSVAPCQRLIVRFAAFTIAARDGERAQMVVSCFGEKMTSEQCLQYIRDMEALPFQGKVSLKNPAHKFFMIRATNPINAQSQLTFVPRRWYFGREIAENDRKCIDTYSLSKRSFLGAPRVKGWAPGGVESSTQRARGRLEGSASIAVGVLGGSTWTAVAPATLRCALSTRDPRRLCRCVGESSHALQLGPQSRCVASATLLE